MEEKQPKKRKGVKRRIFLLLIVLLMGTGLFLLGKMIYTKYVLPRPVAFTTLSPFERRIFDLDASEIKEIEFRSWSSGTEREIQFVRYYTFEKKEDIEKWIEYLNSFRYSHTMPAPSYRSLGGRIYPSCAIRIEKRTGEKLYCRIEEERLCLGEVWYYGDPEYFRPFQDLTSDYLSKALS